MKILSVTYHDDNFGDMLIRICFKQLLKVVMQNLGVKKYVIEDMHLKAVNENSIRSADMIFFAGGGLFGLSYLGFYDSMKKIIDIAEKNVIPVYFSSVGVNNMDLNEENEHLLHELLSKKVIQSIAVREDEDTFIKFAGNSGVNIVRVCDPVVWAGSVFKGNLQQDSEISDSTAVGINVVRGGLFKSNGVLWEEADELKYLQEIHDALEKRGISHRFFTNGSKADNAMLRKFAEKSGIDEGQISPCHSSYDLVRNINNFRTVVAIRMHASIISYALEKPSVNLIWNPKIPLFYSYINNDGRAIDVEDWDTENLLEMIDDLRKDDNYSVNQEYLMSLYDYLYGIMSDKCEKDVIKYSFDDVSVALQNMPVPQEEEIYDLKYKMEMLEKKHVSDIEKIKTIKRELSEKSEINASLKRKNKELKESIKKMKDSKSWRYTAWLRKIHK